MKILFIRFLAILNHELSLYTECSSALFQHFKTKFIRVSVEAVPFIVERLHIKVLPGVFCFQDGIVVDKILGFEELGNGFKIPLPVIIVLSLYFRFYNSNLRQ